MSSQFVQIPQSTFEELQMDAGVLLNTFDVANPDVDDEDIITATTGGVKVDVVPTYSDLGEDVDNCPNNTKELKHLDRTDVSLSTTALGTSAEMIKLSLGSADITPATYAKTTDVAIAADKTYYTRSGSAEPYTYTPVASPVVADIGNYYEQTSPAKILPRTDLKQSDFVSIWWVGRKSGGGFVAIKIINALSTGGFSLQTAKNGKGQISITITGHVSISAQDVVPVEFYSAD